MGKWIAVGVLAGAVVVGSFGVMSAVKKRQALTAPPPPPPPPQSGPSAPKGMEWLNPFVQVSNAAVAGLGQELSRPETQKQIAGMASQGFQTALGALSSAFGSSGNPSPTNTPGTMSKSDLTAAAYASG